ncbi:MAG TPA: pitrilysin family protein [Patescibacteria group bacterium]|nr:pitrilysin family protein [Patescibacteria group bacterium]
MRTTKNGCRAALLAASLTAAVVMAAPPAAAADPAKVAPAKAAPAAKTPAGSSTAPKWTIPTAIKKLPNGLQVVVSEDHSTPTFGISTVYHVGFRLEPKGRTGFAHLFEHMMFEGSPDAPKGVYSRVVEGGGGIDNGSTRFDYTNYIASAPVSALEPILWLEAGRMKTLNFSPENLANQRDVVKEEIRVNVKNRPYGLFFWTDLGGLAFDKWENAHDGYGSFTDLDAATLADVEAFHKTYYAPNNAAIAIAGDVKPEEAFALVEKYFGGIPSQTVPPLPDVKEAPNTKERTLTQTDPFARVPGLAIGYKLPGPHDPDYAALALLGDLLVNGDASRLYQGLVKRDQVLLQVSGGVGWPLGDPVTIDGPIMLVVFGLYKPNTSAAAVTAAVQKEIDAIAKDGVPEAELARTRTSTLSDFYSNLERLINRADLLAIRQLFTGNAATINDVPGQIAAVTSADLKRVAARWLTPANRSSVDRQPAPAEGPKTSDAAKPGGAAKPPDAPKGGSKP